jgi:hypothetical protein
MTSQATNPAAACTLTDKDLRKVTVQGVHVARHDLRALLLVPGSLSRLLYVSKSARFNHDARGIQ